MPQRIECVDDRSLLVGDHPHFLEINAECGEIFCDIADVLVLGATEQGSLPPTIKSAAVTTSLGGGELAVGMTPRGEGITYDGQDATDPFAITATLPSCVMLLQVTRRALRPRPDGALAYAVPAQRWEGLSELEKFRSHR